MTALTEQDRIAVMAWVDGELPPAERAAFDARLAHEPALASAVARERTLRASLQSAYAPVLDEPVPAGLLDLLAMPDAAAANDPLPVGANDAHRAALAHARRWHWLEWGTMAASLVLVEGLPYKEAAQVLDIPIGTLTSRLARGRDALQAMLGDGDLTP